MSCDECNKFYPGAVIKTKILRRKGEAPLFQCTKCEMLIELSSMKGSNTMNFGQAIEKLKEDCAVARQGWNGKSMYIYLENMLHIAATGTAKRVYEPVIIMYTAQGKHQPGWLASQADILSTDWEIVNIK